MKLFLSHVYACRPDSAWGTNNPRCQQIFFRHQCPNQCSNLLSHLFSITQNQRCGQSYSASCAQHSSATLESFVWLTPLAFCTSWQYDCNEITWVTMLWFSEKKKRVLLPAIFFPLVFFYSSITFFFLFVYCPFLVLFFNELHLYFFLFVNILPHSFNFISWVPVRCYGNTNILWHTTRQADM